MLAHFWASAVTSGYAAMYKEQNKMCTTSNKQNFIVQRTQNDQILLIYVKNLKFE